MLRHSSDFTHVLVYHLGPLILVGILLYVGVFLVIKLATRSNKPGKPKQPKTGGLNRHQRREARAMNKRQRHF